MCRNIKRLRRDKPPIAHAEFEEAARNLVRKLSGFREPAPHNQEVFETSVREITDLSRDLLKGLKFKGGVNACVET